MTMSSLTRQVMASLIHAHNLTAADLVELAKELGDSATPSAPAGSTSRSAPPSGR